MSKKEASTEPMHIAYRPDGIIILSLNGVFSPDQDSDVMNSIEEVIDESRFLIIDLSNATSIDPKSGMALVLMAGKDLLARGGSLVLCGTHGKVRTMFDMVGMFHVITHFDTLEKALEHVWESKAYIHRFDSSIVSNGYAV